MLPSMFYVVILNLMALGPSLDRKKRMEPNDPFGMLFMPRAALRRRAAAWGDAPTNPCLRRLPSSYKNRSVDKDL